MKIGQPIPDRFCGRCGRQCVVAVSPAGYVRAACPLWEKWWGLFVIRSGRYSEHDYEVIADELEPSFDRKTGQPL